MSGLVGDSHQAALDELVAAYKRVAGGKASELVVLTAPVGWGKTRVVHDFYAHLASHHQPDGAAYWPPVLVENPDQGDPTKARKKANPGQFLAQGGSEIPYLWWGLSCQPRQDGRLANAVADDISQLIAHLGPVLRSLERKAETNAQFNALTGALFSAIPFPGAAGLIINLQGAPSAALRLFRSVFQSEPGSDDERMVDPSGAQDELLDQWVPALGQALESAGVPMVVFVDDAHWADPSTIEFLDRLLIANAPALVVITAWPDQLDLQSHNPEKSDAGSFVGRWEDRLTPLSVNQLGDHDLAKVAAAALGVDPESELATQLAQRANSNPLLLRLWADVDFVASAAAGGNGLDDANLGRLPATVHDAYLHRWDALPRDVRRVLSAGACLGSEFVPDVVAACLDHSELMPNTGDTAAGIAQAAEHWWIRNVTDDVDQFTEPTLHEIASEKPVFSTAEQKGIRLAFCEVLAQVKGNDRWDTMSVRARSALLGSHIAVTALTGAGRVDDDIMRIVDSHLQLGDLQTESHTGWASRRQLLAAGLSLLETDDATDSAVALNVRGRLAVVVERMGEANEALPLYEQTLTEAERILGVDHPNALASRNNLALCLQTVGRAEAALPLYEQTLTDFERILGVEHPDTLTSRNNLALSLERVGRAEAALPLFEQTLTHRQRILGVDHPDTLTSRNNLALCLQTVGRAEAALPLYEQTLTDRQRILGVEHPHTLTSRNNLALCLKSVGRAEAALPLYEQTLTDSERILGPHHPDTLGSLNNLAVCLETVGRADAALPLFEQTLTDSERILGVDHPNTLTSRSNLAGCLETVGRAFAALPLYEQTLTDRQRILGVDHPDTLTSRNNLAVCLKTVRQTEAALPLFEQTLTDRQRILGVDHPDTLTSRNNLAVCLETAGRAEAAITLYEQTLIDRQRILGVNHPDTLTSRNNLAHCLELVGHAGDAAHARHGQTPP